MHGAQVVHRQGVALRGSLTVGRQCPDGILARARPGVVSVSESTHGARMPGLRGLQEPAEGLRVVLHQAEIAARIGHAELVHGDVTARRGAFAVVLQGRLPLSVRGRDVSQRRQALRVPGIGRLREQTHGPRLVLYQSERPGLDHRAHPPQAVPVPRGDAPLQVRQREAFILLDAAPLPVGVRHRAV